MTQSARSCTSVNTLDVDASVELLLQFISSSVNWLVTLSTLKLLDRSQFLVILNSNYALCF